MNKTRYQKLVGKLIYLSHTRPDIAFAVSLVSQFMHSPYEKHLGSRLSDSQILEKYTRQGVTLPEDHTAEHRGIH